MVSIGCYLWSLKGLVAGVLVHRNLVVMYVFQDGRAVPNFVTISEGLVT